MSKSAKVTTNFRPAETADQVTDRMADLVNEIQRTLQKNMKLRINDKYPPASVSPNPPHKRTGNLGRSILTDRVRKFGSRKRVGLVRIDAPYARPLEFGASLPGGQPYFYHKKEGRIVYVKRSKRGQRKYKLTKPGVLEPRPFVEPSVREVRKQIPRKVRDFVVNVRRSIRTSASRRLA